MKTQTRLPFSLMVTGPLTRTLLPARAAEGSYHFLQEIPLYGMDK